jgi:sigma-B regulation protein RsbU (phosphoserine phosphatase)
VGGGELDYKLEMKARDEIGHLAFTFNAMAINLKKAQAELIVKERLQQEMEIANQIQKMLVPKVSPSIPGYSIGQMYRSAEEVGGDYFDFIDLGKQQWGMVVADVSGKGVPGALVMAQTRAVMRSIAHDSTSPAKVLARTNAQLYGDMRENMFVTLSYFVLDAPKRSVTLSRAGHLAALIYRRASRTCEIEMPIGIAIGISDPETFELMLTESKVKLNPGDFILVYTDGVDEAANINKELFGADRLVQTLIQSADQSADQIVKSIDKAIRDFTRGAAQSDDITMILIKAET